MLSKRKRTFTREASGSVSKRIRLALFLVLLTADPVLAGSHLLYFEAQGVGGYSTEKDGAIYYSVDKADVMQKPSIGFDFVQRLSGETGDYATLALQLRLAYNQPYEELGQDRFQFQLYNAFFKYKAGFSDLWIGHSRMAFGLASYFDSHAQLLQPLIMQGYGFDRDWGAGATRDFEWGNLALSYTSGTGMPLRFEGNYLFSARISKGVLARDNYNLGLSTAYGKTLDTMGYLVLDSNPQEYFLVDADFTYLWNNIENRFEVAAGDRMDKETYALFWRIGLNLLEEDRLKIEFQPVYWKLQDEGNYLFSGGVTYKLTSDVTLRGLYSHDANTDDNRFVLQVYFYHKL
jgi:hypothetical protein